MPSPAPVLHLSLLGAFRARFDTGDEARIAARKARALLAFLGLPPGRLHERDKLAALLWGDRADGEARHSLRQTLSQLRRAVPGALLVGDEVGLAPGAVRVDAVAFEDAASNRASLERAADLYTGDLLDGFHIDAEPFAEWLRGERERLRNLAVEALARRLDRHAREGAAAEGITVALRLLQFEPHREPVHRTLMRLYARQGRRAEALHQYQRLIESLRRDLGAEPEAETRRLYQALLRQPLAPVRDATRQIPPDDEVRDGGRADPPLIGRDAELLKLVALADTANLGRGRAVALLAESGGGKTRMLRELVARWRAGGGRVLQGRCHEIQQTVPLALWSAALAELVPVDMDRILGPGSLARRLLATLLTEPGALLIDPETATQGNRAVLFDAVAEIVTRLAGERPLALVLDDLQWADHRSVELLGHVTRRLVRAPVLLALAVRDEELVDRPRLDALLLELARDGALDRLALAPLSRDQIGRLVRSLSAVDTTKAELDRTSALAWRVSEGNPLLAIEAARDAASSAKPLQGKSLSTGSPVPDRARRLLEGRLERVSVDAMRMAELAAVLGREFELAVIAKAAGQKVATAAGVVEELVRRRIFRSHGSHLEFGHDLLRETIAARLSDETLAGLHRAVAVALAAAGDPETPSIAKRLAYHYSQAGVAPKAIEWLTRYADQSLRVFAPDEAVRALEQALLHVAILPLQRREARRLELLLELAKALSITGQFGEILRRLLPEEPQIARLGLPLLAAQYYSRIVLTQAIVEDPHRLAEMSALGIAAAEQAQNAEALGRLLYAVSAGCYIEGRLQEGMQRARSAVDCLRRADEGYWLVLALWVLGLHHLIIGDLDAALAAEKQSVEVAVTFGDAGLASFGAVSIAWIHLERGDLAAAEAQCKEVLGRLGDGVNALSAVGLMGLILIERGDSREGMSLLARAVNQLPIPSRRDIFAIPLGEAYAMAGDLVQAREVATIVDQAAKRSSSRFRHGRAERLAAVLAVAEGRSADAERLLAAAVENFTCVPAPLELAAAHLAVARAAVAHGKPVQARRCFDLASADYDACRLPLQIERVAAIRSEAGL